MTSRNWISQPPELSPTGNDISPANGKHKTDQKTSEGPTGLGPVTHGPSRMGSFLHPLTLTNTSSTAQIHSDPESRGEETTRLARPQAPRPVHPACVWHRRSVGLSGPSRALTRCRLNPRGRGVARAGLPSRWVWIFTSRGLLRPPGVPKGTRPGWQGQRASMPRPLEAEFLGPASGNGFGPPPRWRWAHSSGQGRNPACPTAGTSAGRLETRPRAGPARRIAAGPLRPPPPGPSGVPPAATGATPRVSRPLLLPSPRPGLAPPSPAPARAAAPPTSARATLTAARAARRAGRSEPGAQAGGAAGPGAGRGREGGGARPGGGRGAAGPGWLRLPAPLAPLAAGAGTHPGQRVLGGARRCPLSGFCPCVPRNTPRVHPDPAPPWTPWFQPRLLALSSEPRSLPVLPPSPRGFCPCTSILLPS